MHDLLHFFYSNSSVLHVWQFDPLLYWQYPKFSSKSLINAFLCIAIIVPRPFMKIVEEISPKANPFTRAQECFCFYLQCGNPYCALVTKTHLSVDPGLTQPPRITLGVGCSFQYLWAWETTSAVIVTACCFHGPTGEKPKLMHAPQDRLAVRMMLQRG